MAITIVGYRGLSPPSRAIQFQTRSPHSHVAVKLGSGAVVEALPWRPHFGIPWPGRVVHAPDWREYHTPGTSVDVFEFVQPLNAAEEKAALEYLFSVEGRRYAMKKVLRFLTRAQHRDSDGLFCSELVAEMCERANRPLFNDTLPPYMASPRDVLASPVLIRTEKRLWT